ncbi:substrate binding domain-containing protein [Maritalea myrionectae]|nr:substrate binding domain-containing protein [Maritalea myrionectae]
MEHVAAEAIDLAIRLAPAPTGNLISTRLMDTRYRVCASPHYLAHNEDLKVPQDLVRHQCLRFALPEYRTHWRFKTQENAAFEVNVAGHLVITNALSLRRAALAGFGPALMADWLVASDLAEGRLVDLFPNHECTATEFDTAAFALYPSRAYLPQKVRVMIDFLREKLGSR